MAFFRYATRIVTFYNFTFRGLLKNSVSFSAILTSAEFTQQFMESRFNKKVLKSEDEAMFPVSKINDIVDLNFFLLLKIYEKIIFPAQDYKSLSRYALLGCFGISPMLYTYYCWLDKTFPGRAVTTVAKKVCNDVFFANVAYYSMFYYGMSYLEHQNHEKAKAEVKKAFGLSYLAGMLYWIPVMSINFVYFTPQHRVLFIAIGSFVEMNGEI